MTSDQPEQTAESYLRQGRRRSSRRPEPEAEQKPTRGLVSHGARSGGYPRPEVSPDALIRSMLRGPSEFRAARSGSRAELRRPPAVRLAGLAASRLRAPAFVSQSKGKLFCRRSSVPVQARKDEPTDTRDVDRRVPSVLGTRRIRRIPVREESARPERLLSDLLWQPLDIVHGVAKEEVLD